MGSSLSLEALILVALSQQHPEAVCPAFMKGRPQQEAHLGCPAGILSAPDIFATCSLITGSLLLLACSPRGEAMSWAVSRVPGGGVLGRSAILMAVAANAARAVSSCSSNLSISELATVVSWDQSTSPFPAGMAQP